MCSSVRWQLLPVLFRIRIWVVVVLCRAFWSGVRSDTAGAIEVLAAVVVAVAVVVVVVVVTYKRQVQIVFHEPPYRIGGRGLVHPLASQIDPGFFVIVIVVVVVVVVVEEIGFYAAADPISDLENFDFQLVVGKTLGRFHQVIGNGKTRKSGSNHDYFCCRCCCRCRCRCRCCCCCCCCCRCCCSSALDGEVVSVVVLVLK